MSKNREIKSGSVGFPCDCGEVFETAEDFTNHFGRNDPKLTCELSPAAVKKLRKP